MPRTRRQTLDSADDVDDSEPSYAQHLEPLLSAFAKAQAQSNQRAAAARGENPWVVHLRVAVSTSGLLNTCVGSIIGDSWVLTSATCIRNARFVWVRYAAVDVTRPELVTETSNVRFHPEIDVALVRINRPIDFSDNIKPIELASADAEIPATGRFCGWGVTAGNPGETLNCFNVNIRESDDGNQLITSSSVRAGSNFDRGGPLFSNGVQFGVLNGPGPQRTGVFAKVSNVLDWIQAETAALEFEDDSFGSELDIVN